jgi:hypothetical protein
MNTVQNLFDLQVDIAQYYLKMLVNIEDELEDPTYGLPLLENGDFKEDGTIDDIRYLCLEYSFNEYQYFAESSTIDARFGLDFDVANANYEYLADNGCPTDDMFPLKRENVYNQYAYWYSKLDMMDDIPIEKLKEDIVEKENVILKMCKEYTKKGIKTSNDLYSYLEEEEEMNELQADFETLLD